MLREKIYHNVIKKLYESTDANSIIDRIASEFAKASTNKTSDEILDDYRMYIGRDKYRDYDGNSKQFKIDAYKAFIKDNIKEFYQILKSNKQFKYKGAGSWGFAFDLGNHILKIEYMTDYNAQFSGLERSTRTDDFLWDGWVNGKILPMIYDKGYFHFHEGEYNWTILEKFENIKDRQIESILDDLIQEMAKLIENGYANDMIIHDIKNGRDFKNYLNDIQQKLFLNNDWLESLLKSMKQLKKGGFPVDFHGGNIGIRRTGQTGELIFFD